MQSSLPRESGPLEDTAAGLGWGLFLCRALAASVEVFLHRNIGERYLNWQAVAVLVIVPVFALGWEPHDSGPLMVFLMLYVLMCAVSRIRALRRRGQGSCEHSYYTGWPRLIGPKAKCSEMTFKRVFEPLLVVSGGFLLTAWNPPLGTYLMFAAGGLFLSMTAIEVENQSRALDMHDAALEQERLTERFRDLRGDRWL